MSKMISEWASYMTFFDASMIASLKADTPFVGRHISYKVPFRCFSYDKPYEGHIHTPGEKLLIWEPWAVTITFLALIASIAVWVIR
jgi:hypothetical protein